jgi:hypothetical protein
MWTSFFSSACPEAAVAAPRRSGKNAALNALMMSLRKLALRPVAC